MDKLVKYKIDKAFTEGVDIRLDDAPEVCFRVRLPSQYNRGYTNKLYSGMNLKISEDGKVNSDANVMDAKYASEDAFVDHCLVSMDGDPIPDSFAADYPTALSELIGKATELAAEIEARVSDTAKKSPSLSDGKESGQANKRSTVSLKSGAA